MSDLTEINIYGQIAEEVGQNQWYLQISSVREALHAININCNRRLYRVLLDLEKRKAKYQILVNERELDLTEKDLKDIDEKDLNTLVNQLGIQKKIEKIDIVPVIEGGGTGIELIIIGSILAAMETAWVIALGIGLIMTGIALMLSKPPDFGQFREIQQVNQKDSYLFSGPVNFLGEGGPVPVGYGRLIIGSLGIQLNYFTEDKASPIQDASAPTSSSTVTEIVYDLGKSNFGPQILGPITPSNSLTPVNPNPIMR